MKTVVIRTLTGMVFITVVVGAILMGPLVFAAVFLLIGVLGLAEYYKILHAQNKDVAAYPMFACGIFVYVMIALYAHNLINSGMLMLMVPAYLMLFIFELYRKKSMPFTNAAMALSGVLFISVPLALMNFLYSPFSVTGGNCTQILIGFFIITWTTDTAAYLSGMAFGRHRLFERISPKKSWEGSAGGVVFALLAAYVISLFFKDIALVHWLAIAMIIVVAGTFGDLAESLLKRSAGVKDSGTLLPGHGGILDRFDSVLFSGPVVFVYIHLFITHS